MGFTTVKYFNPSQLLKSNTFNKIGMLKCEKFSDFLFRRVGAKVDKTSSQISQSVQDCENKRRL